MMEREYYSIGKASEILGCDENDLIYQGANGHLPIFVVVCIGKTRSLWRKRFTVEGFFNSSTPIRYYCNSSDFLARVATQCLREIEAGHYPVEISLEKETIYDLDTGKPEFYEVLELIDTSTGDHPENCKAVLVSTCNLVVMEKDLHNIQKNTMAVIDNQTPAQLIDDQKALDKRTVQVIGRKLLEKYAQHSVQMNCTQAKKLPSLKNYYDKYPGKDPVIVDEWLQAIGMPPGKRGRQSKDEECFIPSLD